MPIEHAQVSAVGHAPSRQSFVGLEQTGAETNVLDLRSLRGRPAQTAAARGARLGLAGRPVPHARQVQLTCRPVFGR